MASRAATPLIDRGALEQRVARHLWTLAGSIGARPAGSPANRDATDYVTGVLRAAGVTVEELPFEARFWIPGPVRLLVDGEVLELPPSPFSQPTNATGRVVTAASIADLEPARIPHESIVVLHGEATVSPYFPIAFPFASIPEQVSFLERLASLGPLAVLAVAHDDRAEVPILEDGDLPFPYATVPRHAGPRLVSGQVVHLDIGGDVRSGSGVNVGGTRTTEPTVLVSAHIDTKATTCGALDNAAAVAGLLGLIEADPPALRSTHFVFFNGEDHYAAPGEQAWLAVHEPDRYGLVLNLDGLGLAGHRTAVAPLACSPELEAAVDAGMAGEAAVVRGPPWYESDHAVFATRGIPSIALTTDAPFEELKRRIHATDDSPSGIDTKQVAATVAWVAELIGALGTCHGVRAPIRHDGRSPSRA